ALTHSTSSLPSFPAPRDLPSFPTRRSSDLARLPRGYSFERSLVHHRNRFRRTIDAYATAEVSRERVRYRSPEGPLLRRSSAATPDRKSTRLNSSHVKISYAVFCLKKKKEIP